MRFDGDAIGLFHDRIVDRIRRRGGEALCIGEDADAFVRAPAHRRLRGEQQLGGVDGEQLLAMAGSLGVLAGVILAEAAAAMAGTRRHRRAAGDVRGEFEAICDLFTRAAWRDARPGDHA